MSSVLGDHIDRFGGGPGGNSEGTFNTNTRVGMGEWRDQYRTRFSCEPPADGKIVTAAVTYDCPGGRDFLLRGERRGGMLIAHALRIAMGPKRESTVDRKRLRGDTKRNADAN